MIFLQSSKRWEIAWLKRNSSCMQIAIQYNKPNVITTTKGFCGHLFVCPFWFVPAKWPHITWDRFRISITANDRRQTQVVNFWFPILLNCVKNFYWHYSFFLSYFYQPGWSLKWWFLFASAIAANNLIF